ncbi:NAD-dependent epimerase/dehydratase family protein [Paenibacillus validus]|uniref:NAD-dependent epimerase/dehydratase family protein n=1 Tax=Paenibacillus validus TaxID=44253 RepID=UPI000FD770C8|nr:NAD-dependent epimerase/dehydratase family protein [Paenibacillus validus]MED4601253.1 NAD-dependent epimerase/dehydratase family protein [Paenibacillus validus]MED4605458.1 NAD-dependent epimerase/dehydratase family protein [Paenibacillus validus]
MLTGKKVFISGGAGVIGQELVKKLLQRGAEVMVGDIKPRPHGWDSSIIYRQGDLNYISCQELQRFQPEYVFHLAATFERSVETYEFWNENYEHNVRLSHHLMHCLKDIPTLRKVVFASSYLIYNPATYTFQEPAFEAVNLKEEGEIYPRNLCGVAKLLHEMELQFLHHFRGTSLQTVSARIYRSYGKNSRDIISRWIRALLQDETITVFRKEGLFDYIYAEDGAEGLIRLAESDAVGIVNLGSGRARRVQEVLDVLALHFPHMKVTEGDSDIPYEASQADMSLFKKWTGWAPERHLEDTIPEMIAYERDCSSSEVRSEPFRILISSVSKKIPLLKSVNKAVQKLGLETQIIGADNNPNCIGKHFTDMFWEMPRLGQLPVTELIRYCNEHDVKCIIPTRDGELSYYAEHQSELKQHGIHVMISKPDTVQKCLDKQLFYETLKNAGFPAIPTSTSIKDMEAEKYVVKERFGAGSESLGLDLNKEMAVLHALNLKQPIFQPFIIGKEYSIDLYRDRMGRVKGTIVRSRDLVVNGESQISKTENNPELEKLAYDIADHLGLYGHAVLQVLVDEKGMPHIIECNTRFGGASTLSVEAGLDSFYWFLLESAGADISEYPFLRSKKEKRLIRFAEDLIV